MHASIVRIIADSSGGSRFADAVDTLVPTDFAPPAPLLDASEPRPATRTRFIGAPAGWDSPPHPAPALEWVIMTVFTSAIPALGDERDDDADGGGDERFDGA